MISQEEFQEKMVGRWAVCGHGRLGRMTHMHERGRGRLFGGVGLDGRPWQSMAPLQLNEKESARLDAVLDLPSVRQMLEEGP